MYDANVSQSILPFDDENRSSDERKSIGVIKMIVIIFGAPA